MDKLLQALAQLLPTGFAWPRHASSVLMRWVLALAGVHAELMSFIHATAAQWQPHRTTLRLAEWEESCGLPDTCFGPEQTDAQRRSVLLMKLRGVQLPYTDSSPAAPGVIQSICAGMGYTAQIIYNTPFRAGLNRVGDRLGALNGELYVTVSTDIQPFRVGVNKAGDRLVSTEHDLFLLQSYLKKILPSRFDVVVLPQS